MATWLWHYTFMPFGFISDLAHTSWIMGRNRIKRYLYQLAEAVYKPRPVRFAGACVYAEFSLSDPVVV